MGRVQGRVYRSDTDLPIRHVTATLFGSGLEPAETATTDHEGHYLFPKVQPGIHTLTIELRKTDGQGTQAGLYADQNEEPGRTIPVGPALPDPALAKCKTIVLTCNECYAVVESSPGVDWAFVSVQFLGPVVSGQAQGISVTAGQVLEVDLGIGCGDIMGLTPSPPEGDARIAFTSAATATGRSTS